MAAPTARLVFLISAAAAAWRAELQPHLDELYCQEHPDGITEAKIARIYRSSAHLSHRILELQQEAEVMNNEIERRYGDVAALQNPVAEQRELRRLRKATRLLKKTSEWLERQATNTMTASLLWWWYIGLRQSADDQTS